MSLLTPTTAGAEGLAVSAQAVTAPTVTVSDTHTLAPHQGCSAYDFILEGGMMRWGDHYLATDAALGDVADFNYVEGLQWGTHFTLGYVTRDSRRWEVTPTLRYGCSSHRWQGQIALRYLDRVDRGGWIELSGGEVTQDFNATPYLGGGQAAMAMSLFGWDHQKFYRLTHATLRGSVPLDTDWSLEGSLAWQCRAAQLNARHTSFFGRHVAPNLAGFATTEVLKAALTLSYTPHSLIRVYDDMTALRASRWPTFTLGVTATTDTPEAHRSLASLRRRERWQIGVERDDLIDGWILNPSRGHTLTYAVCAGLFTGRRDGLLMDMQHFEASRFGWQTHATTTWFSNLNDYELSTDRAWVMASLAYADHAPWLTSSTLGDLTAIASLRVLKVACVPLHTELGYMLSLSQGIGLGATLSLRDARYDAVGLRLVLNTRHSYDARPIHQTPYN